MYIIFGAEPLVAGYIIALESLGWTVVAISTSGVRGRIEPRLIRLGSVLVSISMVGLIYAMPSGPLWLIALLAILMGMGFGMSWTFVSKRIIANVPETERTRASALNPHFPACGNGVGIGPQAESLPTSQDFPKTAAWKLRRTLRSGVSPLLSH